MLKPLFRSCVAMAALVLHFGAAAEDIDLFVGSTPTTTDAPNVLIIIDNTANWNTAFTNEMSALASVFSSLPADKFRVGMMMFTETGGGNSGNDGAYVRAAIRPMTTANKALYASMISGFNQTGDKSNGGKVGKAMEEAYLYLKGLTPHAGNNKNKTDYTGNTAGSAADDAVHAVTGNALDSKTGTTYTSPVEPGCAKNYIIYISNGPAQDNSSDITQATGVLAAQGGNTTMIPLNPSGSQDNPADEWARFMKKSSLNASVYTIDINKTTTGQGPGWTALLKSMAGQSQGKYFDIASSGTQILDALNKIFSEIQSVNSVFASVSLPVSVNTQGNYLNQVYVGMFRPDQDAAPRWAGNLKQYKLGRINGSLRLLDADAASAINNQTGFIAECARSYWTPTTVDTEWSHRPIGDCLTVANSDVSNYPDGNVVDKGAQAYVLRSTSTRNVKTCNSSSVALCTSGGLLSFDNTNVSQTALGASSTTERDAIINWAIGQDNMEDEDLDGVTTAERRKSIHGDVVHSRPVAVNFGTEDSPQVVVFYGANDGMLRAVNGNRSAAIGSVAAGAELWSFMPPEFYDDIKRLRDNTPVISYPNTTTTGGLPKPYGIDGTITAFKGSVGGTQKTFLYATMRRGGRAIYAFDVTDTLTSPTAPVLKWKIGCDSTGCSTGMSGVGQTWSSLQSFYATGYGSGTSPLLIMGGGYDTCEDTDALSAGGANHNCTSSSTGHYVYVLDADTGAVVATFDTGGTRGIIADVLVATDNAGMATYGWTADLGGNVYRINFGSGAPGTWTMTKIASLGCDTTASCTANRKFMFVPSVVALESNEYAVTLGSGDREKPLTYYASTAAVENYFFMFTDKPSVATSTWPGSTDCGSEVICLNSLLELTDAEPSAAALAAKKGWYLPLAAGEQVVTSAVTIFNVTTFSTHQPLASSTCSANLGAARLYNVFYTNGATGNGTSDRFQDLSGDGLPPSPVAGIVKLDDGEETPFCIGCDPESPLEGGDPPSPGTVTQPKGRLYWYIQK